MHVIVLTCVALKAVGVRQYIQFALIGGNVLTALVNLPLQTVRLADTLDLLDKTLVADKEEEYAENKARDSVFVHYPTIEPRVLVKIFPDVSKLHLFARLQKNRTKLSKILDICKLFALFF